MSNHRASARSFAHVTHREILEPSTARLAMILSLPRSSARDVGQLLIPWSTSAWSASRRSGSRVDMPSRRGGSCRPGCADDVRRLEEAEHVREVRAMMTSRCCR